jgi:hypothetical protein
MVGSYLGASGDDQGEAAAIVMAFGAGTGTWGQAPGWEDVERAIWGEAVSGGGEAVVVTTGRIQSNLACINWEPRFKVKRLSPKVLHGVLGAHSRQKPGLCYIDVLASTE